MHLYVPRRFVPLLLLFNDILPAHVLYIAITSVRCQTKSYPKPLIVEGAKRIFGVNKQTVYSDLTQYLKI